MPYVKGAGGHYSRSSFHNNCNYKQRKNKGHFNQRRVVTHKDIKQKCVESMRRVYHETHMDYVQFINSEENKKLQEVKEGIQVKKVISELNTSIPDFSRLSMVLIDPQVELDSHVYIFSENDKFNGYPTTLWVISSEELSLKNLEIRALLKKHTPTIFVDMPELKLSLKKLKGRCTDLLKIHHQVKDDPQLIRLLHSSGQLKICMQEMLFRKRNSGCFLTKLYEV